MWWDTWGPVPCLSRRRSWRVSERTQLGVAMLLPAEETLGYVIHQPVHKSGGRPLRCCPCFLAILERILHPQRKPIEYVFILRGIVDV